MEHIPYKGDAPMNAALMSGEIQVAATPISTAAPLIAAGKLKALAVTGLKRSPALPEVPTADESGVTGFEFMSWQGYFMPGHASRDVAQRFYRETARVVALPDVRDRLVGMGSEIVASTPEAFATRYRADVARFLKVVKESGIPLQD
jgi:tripartite-type tricarboxylate transporter receptor subunit TctC